MDMPPVIQRYVAAFEALDVEALLACLSDNVAFVNIQHGRVTITADGKESFRELGEQSVKAFSARRLHILSIERKALYWVAEIKFEGTLARELNPDMPKGFVIAMAGLILFHLHDDMIVSIADVS